MQTRCISFIIAAMLALPFSANSQEHGIRAGYQSSNQFVDSENLAGNLQFFYAGFFRNTYFGNNTVFSLHKGLEYYQGGFYEDENTFRRLHYINVPVAARFELGPIFILGGVSPAFKVGETYQILGIDVKDDDTKGNWFDLPAIIGAGIELGPIGIEGRYGYSLIEVNDGIRNAYVQLGIYIIIGDKVE